MKQDGTFYTHDEMREMVKKHKHIEITPGVVANMDTKASPKTREALVAMAKAVRNKRTASDLIADHFGYRVLRDEPFLPGDVMIHDGSLSVVLRRLTPVSNA